MIEPIDKVYFLPSLSCMTGYVRRRGEIQFLKEINNFVFHHAQHKNQIVSFLETAISWTQLWPESRRSSFVGSLMSVGLKDILYRYFKSFSVHSLRAVVLDLNKTGAKNLIDCRRSTLGNIQLMWSEEYQLTLLFLTWWCKVKNVHYDKVTLYPYTLLYPTWWCSEKYPLQGQIKSLHTHVSHMVMRSEKKCLLKGHTISLHTPVSHMVMWTVSLRLWEIGVLVMNDLSCDYACRLWINRWLNQ